MLVPVDLAPETALVVRAAVDLARGPGARVRLLHVFDRRAVEDVYKLHGLREEEARSRMRVKAEAAVERLRAGVRRRGLGLDTRYRSGLPAQEILEEAAAWKADLLVLGRRRRSGLAHFLYGATADGVVRDAPCAVLVIAS